MMVELIKFAFGSSLLLAGVAWLVRETFKHVLTKDIEQFKSALNRAAVEHEIRFARLHVKAAETISETYARLQWVSIRLADYLTPTLTALDPKRQDYLEKLREAYRDFDEYFRPRRLYLPRVTADRIWEAAKAMQDVEWGFSVPTGDGGIDPKLAHEAHSVAFRAFRHEIKPLLNKLEDEFRAILNPAPQA